MAAEYTNNMNLFKPGTDDNVGIEASLSDNFQKIDDKLGNALKDRTGKEYASAGERMNTEQASNDAVKVDVEKLKKKSDNVVLQDNFFRTIAHRGMVMASPENTLPSFRWAIENGHWGIETDIHLTSDNKWVCIHDDTVDRTTDGTGAVVGKTLSQIRALDAGSWFAGTYYATRIPTLDEYLMVCKSGQAVPFIEVKPICTDVQMQDLVNILTKWQMLDDATIISGNLDNLKKIRFYTDRLALGYVTSTLTQQNVDDTVALGNAFLDVFHTAITEEAMQLARTKDIIVYAWTVNKHVDKRRLMTLGVNGITTDHLVHSRGM